MQFDFLKTPLVRQDLNRSTYNLDRLNHEYVQSHLYRIKDAWSRYGGLHPVEEEPLGCREK